MSVFTDLKKILRDSAVVIVFSIVIVVALVWGYRKATEKCIVSRDDKVIASVGDYNIYDSDLAYMVKLAAPSEKFPVDGLNDENIKNDLLDEMITKKVLVREAQRRGFDREEAFMKEIEKYWEQALIKFLIQAKSREITMSIEVTTSEVTEEYNKRKLRFLSELVLLDNMDDANKLAGSKAGFEKIKEGLKGKITLEEQLEWRGTEELPKALEKQVLNMSAGEISDPIPYEDGWVVIRVNDIKEVDMPPLQEIEGQIREDIMESKSEEELDKWISSLRNSEKVQINGEVLKNIDLEKLYHDK